MLLMLPLVALLAAASGSDEPVIEPATVISGRDPFDPSRHSNFICILYGPRPIATLTLRGVVESAGVSYALFEQERPDSKLPRMFVGKVGTRFWDGEIEKISQEAVFLRELVVSKDGSKASKGKAVYRLTLLNPRPQVPLQDEAS